MQTYGDYQSQLTMNRAAYGDVSAAMITGASTTYGGAAQGLGNLYSDIGEHVMPAVYTPPARVYIGSQGMVQQHTGLMRGLLHTVGIGQTTPRGTTTAEFGTTMAGDTGERVGSGVAAVGSLGAGALVGATAGRMVGTGVGAAVGSLLGPAGTAVGAAVGGFVGGAAGTIAMESGITGAINQRREIQSYLETSSFRFVGAGSDMSNPITGRGMSRGARREVADFIREQDIADPMYDTSDMTDIMKGSAELGLFGGMSDMDDFKRRFKDITKNVKTVTKVLHQTLEEGLKTIKDLKTIGVDPSKAGAFVQSADALGATSGRTATEMISIGMQGAEMFRGTGVDMTIGFQANQMNLAAVRAARDAGTLASEAVAQAGGEEALAQRMTASGLGFSQSAMGRGVGAQFFQGGGFNQQNFMQQMMAGGGDFVSGAQTAANNLSNPAALISYQANQEKFVSEMGKTMGGQGLIMNQLGAAASYAEYIARSTGAKKEDAFRLALKQQGMSHPEIETHLARMKGADEELSAKQAGAAATRDKMIIEQASENFVLNRVSAKVGDYVKGAVDVVAAPMNRMIDATAEGFSTFYEEQVLGVQRADVRGVDIAGLSEKDYQNFRERQGETTNLDEGGFLATTAGEDLLNALQSGALEGFGVEQTFKRGLSGRELEEDDIIINEVAGGLMGAVNTIKERDLQTLSDARRRFAVTTRQAEEMAEKGELDDISTGIGEALLRGEMDDVKTTEDLVKTAFGEDVILGGEPAEGQRLVSRGEIAKLRTQVKGTRFEKMLNETSKALGVAGNAQEAGKVADLRALQDRFTDDKDKLLDALGVGGLGFADIGKMEMSSEVTNLVSRALDADLSPEEKERLIKEASMKQLAFSGDEKEAQKLAIALQNADPNAISAAQDLRATAAGIAQTQVGRGSKVMADIVRARLNESDLEVKDIKRVESITASIESKGLLMLGKEDRDFLKDTGLATDILGRVDKITALDEAAKEGKTGRVEEILKEDMGLKGTKLKEAVEKATSGDVQSVIKELDVEFSRQLAGDTAVAAAGGASLTGDGMGEAQQVFTQQSNINLQVLSVMQGLAARLGVQ